MISVDDHSKIRLGAFEKKCCCSAKSCGRIKNIIFQLSLNGFNQVVEVWGQECKEVDIFTALDALLEL